jgi:AraC-like DNA-binding protein
MPNEPAIMRFSSADLPPQDRATILREVFGRGLCNMEIVPLTDAPEVEAELRTMPGLTVTWGRNSPHRFETTRDLNRGSDEIVMGMFASPLRIFHRSKEIVLRQGEAIMMSAAEVATAECASSFRHTSLRLQRRRLAHLIGGPEDTLMRPFAGDRSALRLLTSYLAILRDSLETASADVERAAVDHIYDLVALLAAPDRNSGELMDGRSVRAARLEAIKRYVIENLGRHDLAVAQAAAAQGVSPRYVQMLFEAEGTTFSAFVLKARLASALRALNDPRSLNRPIGSIVFDAGFGDLSYFNRVFKRTYGQTPSDLRNTARKESSGEH